jgi:peroxiredoxin
MRFVIALTFSLFLALTISAQNSIVGTQPTFAALTMDGQKVDTASLKGKVVVMNLWFVNCPNCIEEIGQLNRLVDQYQSYKDVVFLGLAASPKGSLDAFLKKYPFKYQILPNSQMIILTKFGTPDKSGEINVPFPMHFLMDRTGKIVFGGQGIKSIEGLKVAIASQTGGR